MNSMRQKPNVHKLRNVSLIQKNWHKHKPPPPGSFHRVDSKKDPGFWLQNKTNKKSDLKFSGDWSHKLQRFP